MAKILTAYFSCSGATKRVAQTIAKATGSDLFEIRPAAPYTRSDLDWTDRHSRTTIECNDPSSRPQMKESADIRKYDVIYVGFPVRWYKEPNIIDTFLESGNFDGKTIVPFATSGGSGLGKTADNIRAICPGATVIDGFMANGNPSERDIENIIKTLGM